MLQTPKLLILSVILSFTVLACNAYNLEDKLENPAGTASSSKSDAVYVFSVPAFEPPIALATRTGIDNACIASKTFSNSCSTVHGFASISASDQISDMPSNYGVPTNKPIKTTSGTVLQSDWTTMLASGLLVSLGDAGVMPTNNYWWSFSSSTGTFDATYNCVNGTSMSSSENGYTGSSAGTTGQQWISVDHLGCDSSFYVLCLCY